MSKTPKLKPKKGWAVEVYDSMWGNRNRPSELSREAGQLPVVYTSRAWAVKRRERLKTYGLKARVVRVLYAEPVVIRS